MPRLALLDRSQQNAIYQDMSVPQIVEKILRERHNMRGQDFLFSLTKTYPRREQVMQYGEDDLRFITRLLGEVGIWFRFTADTRLYLRDIYDHTVHVLESLESVRDLLADLLNAGEDGLGQTVNANGQANQCLARPLQRHAVGGQNRQDHKHAEHP